VARCGDDRCGLGSRLPATGGPRGGATAFAGLFWLLLRRARAELLPGLLVSASAFATVTGLAGAWQLICMFD
jgi:hypothetical protein